MKKVFAFLIALAMIFSVARPVVINAAGDDNPFNDLFPVDIPVPG